MVFAATSDSRSLMAEAHKVLLKLQENKYGLLERMTSGPGQSVGIGWMPGRG